MAGGWLERLRPGLLALCFLIIFVKNRYIYIYIKTYPIWTEFGEKQMLNAVHVIFRATMLDQPDSAVDVRDDAPVNGLFDTLQDLTSDRLK